MQSCIIQNSWLIYYFPLLSTFVCILFVKLFNSRILLTSFHLCICATRVCVASWGRGRLTWPTGKHPLPAEFLQIYVKKYLQIYLSIYSAGINPTLSEKADQSWEGGQEKVDKIVAVLLWLILPLSLPLPCPILLPIPTPPCSSRLLPHCCWIYLPGSTVGKGFMVLCITFI